MDSNLTLRFRLRSAATFGRGEGLPGLVDQEVEQDEHGFPFLRGRALKGLLVEEAEGILFALDLQDKRANWHTVKDDLFGRGGSTLNEQGNLHVGDARLPQHLQTLLAASMTGPNKKLNRDAVIEGLTGIRQQTAMNVYGGPEHSTLRSMRVVIRSTPFEARLSFRTPPSERELALLSAAVLAFRHAGTARNRGRGWLGAELEDPETTRKYYKVFLQEAGL